MSEPKLSPTKLKLYFADLATSAVSSHVSTLFTAPFDRAKLVMQAQLSSDLIQPSNRCSGIFNALVRISREQGVLSLWRGCVASMLRYYPSRLLNFMLRDKYKALVPRYNLQTEFGKFFATNMFCGLFAGMTTLLFVYPLDLARTRLALDMGTDDTREFTGVWNCLSTIYKRTGFGSLYYGYAAAVAGIVLYRTVYFGVYHLLKLRMLNNSSKQQNFFYMWLVAQFVTLSAAFLAYPLDTIRRNLCMQAGRSDIQYTGTLDCAQKLYANGGIGAFFGGALFNITNTFTGALILVVYDVIKKLWA